MDLNDHVFHPFPILSRIFRPSEQGAFFRLDERVIEKEQVPLFHNQLWFLPEGFVIRMSKPWGQESEGFEIPEANEIPKSALQLADASFITFKQEEL